MKRFGRATQSLLALVIVVTLGCGTVIYPERRGQASGKLDTDIILLDGIGLLLFLVPGVVAFAVDFATGAIYLPRGETSKTREVLGRPVIERHPLPGHDLPAIVGFVAALTGHAIDPSQLQVRRARPGETPEDALVQAAWGSWAWRPDSSQRAQSGVRLDAIALR